MPAGTDLIYFNAPEDWELVTNETRTAEIINENSHTPIPSFDLGVSLNVDYIAVVAGTSLGKPNWFFAGDITQVYAFAPGAGNPVLGSIKPERTRLAINRLQVVETNRISLDPFRLQYTPPSWFKNCTIRVYKYIGETENFVEDTLFDIGNALGIDPNNPNGKITLALAAIRDEVRTSQQELSQQITDCCNQLRQQLSGSQFSTTGGGNFTINDPTDSLGFNYTQGLL
jgi:hypothetical protein